MSPVQVPAEIAVRARAVSVVVMRESAGKTQVLLLERADSLIGEWCQIAGGLEAEETAWQGALRELREETGLTPDRLYSADICEQFYVAAQDIVLMIPVFVAYVDTNAQVELNEEHTDFGWFGFKAARNIVPFGGQRLVLNRIKSEFVKRKPSEHLRIKIPKTA